METGIGAVIGKVKFYRPGEDSSSLKPQMVIKSEVAHTMAPLLTELGELYSPVKSKSLIYTSFNAENFAEPNPRFFVYEEGNWSLKGRYQLAVKVNDSVTWFLDGGEYTLSLALVEFSIIIAVGIIH